MQLYNKLKAKQKQQPQQSRQSQSPLPDTFGINKPPLVDSRSQWNTNVYLVQKWKKKAIQRVDASLHTPFPIRSYINYVQQHSEGFKEELNLDFFKHIFRHFAMNSWWIEETRKFKASIPINIVQISEHTKSNPEYCKLMIQKQVDDLQFYQEILKNTQTVYPPAPSRQIQEYRKSVTYKVLDLQAGIEHKDKSLFQLQDVFVNRIIQLISQDGLTSLGYYDYVTFKNIVQDRIKGLGDAENFTRVLEIRRLFNNVDQIQKQFDQTVSDWQQTDQNKKKKFRRWKQETTIYSDEIAELASTVGLSANLMRAKKNYEMNKTEQNFKELVKIADQIQLTTHKTIMDTLSKIAHEDYNNLSDSISKSIIIEDALQQAREQYEQQKAIIQQEYSDQPSIIKDQCSQDKFENDFSSGQKEIQFDDYEQEPQGEGKIVKPQQKIIKELKQIGNQGLQEQQFQQYSQQQPKSQRNNVQSITPQKRIVLASEHNNRLGVNKSQNRTQAHSQGQDRILQSQWSHQSFKSIDDILNQDHNQDDHKKNKEYQKLDYEDNQNINKTINRNTSHHANTTLQLNSKSNISNNSQPNKNINSSINEDLKVLNEFVQHNRNQQKILKAKILYQDKEREELIQLQEELESISRVDEKSNCKTQRSETKIEQTYHVNKVSEQCKRITESQYPENEQHNVVKLNYGYKIPQSNPSSIPQSISNNTTARTSRNTSNYNSTTQQKKSKAENIEEVLGEQQPTANDNEEPNEIERKVSPNKLSRQTSIRKAHKQEMKGENPRFDSKHEKKVPSRSDIKLDVNQQKETPYEESNNYVNTQQSSEQTPHRSRTEFKSPEKAKRFQKSVTKIIDQNKQIKKESDVTTKINDNLDIRKSRQKTGNKQINESLDDDQEEDEQEMKLKKQKSMKRGQFHSVSMPKIGREDDTRRYLMMLKEELREMLLRRVNLKEIKDHINTILSEIAGIKLDPELEYYLQLYKQRVQELSQVSQQSKEITFQTLQPTVSLTLKKEIKGLKFARNCDRIPKLQPKDLEDTFVIQPNQNEYQQNQSDIQQLNYEPVFRYNIKPQPLVTNLIQQSLDFTRRQTPNTDRIERAGSLIEQDLPLLSQRKQFQKVSPKKKRHKCQGKITIQRDKLSEDFPYLKKYKPELLRSIVEAHINLDQFIQ